MAASVMQLQQIRALDRINVPVTPKRGIGKWHIKISPIPLLRNQFRTKGHKLLLLMLLSSFSQGLVSAKKSYQEISSHT